MFVFRDYTLQTGQHIYNTTADQSVNTVVRPLLAGYFHYSQTGVYSIRRM